MRTSLVNADAYRIPLEDKSVHCVVTSPPYWGLRKYSGDMARVWGGDPDCRHEWETGGQPKLSNGETNKVSQGQFCRRCNAWYGELGLEPTPELYVQHMVEIFREVWRVCRDDATVWVNLGDAYASSGYSKHFERDSDWNGGVATWTNREQGAPKTSVGNLKPKDLVGIPWRVAFALQADGWVLRSDVIWAKPNPMPESVRDRPTKSHEYLFLFSKGIWKGIDSGRFSHISNEDARWLALFFDTEGNVTVKKVTRKSGNDWYGIQIGIASSNRAILEMARNIVRQGTILKRDGTNASMYYWQCSNQIARDLLYRLYPFFVVKQRQARLGIFMQDILAQRGKKRPGGYRAQGHTDLLERMWATNKELNHFGNPDISWIPEPKYGKWNSQPYFYDQDAVREQGEGFGKSERFRGSGYEMNRAFDSNNRDGQTGGGKSSFDGSGRNRRTVWEIPTAPYSGAHFATFPPALVEPCIKSGTSEHGCCPECGAPWKNVVERSPPPFSRRNDREHETFTRSMPWRNDKEQQKSIALDFRPTCKCDAGDPIPCTVLDPFCGSGTTLLVARQLGRNSIGLDLSLPYLQEQARERLLLNALEAWESGKKDGSGNLDELPLFGENVL